VPGECLGLFSGIPLYLFIRDRFNLQHSAVRVVWLPVSLAGFPGPDRGHKQWEIFCSRCRRPWVASEGRFQAQATNALLKSSSRQSTKQWFFFDLLPIAWTRWVKVEISTPLPALPMGGKFFFVSGSNV